YNPMEFFKGLCRFLRQTPSQLRLINLEELTAEQEQQNLPGTTSESPNWQRRVHLPLEQLFSDPAFLERLTIWSQS
ncbi:MAG: 4-alpha-glucanotransferase, partial [Cyanobacteria bacterium]|nr:4-alpha-glucanotransferase [Cyanobacteriota bacterium]